MIDLQGYADVTPALHGAFSKLPPDGYICQIVNAELTKSKAGNPMLVLSVDIAEGDFKNFFSDAFKRVKAFRSDAKWDSSAIYRQLIFANDGSVSRFFKGLITCFAQSNSIFNFNPHAFNEQILRGLLCGFIFAEEEYPRQDGSIAVHSVVRFPRNVNDIRNHNFSIPPLKKMPAQIHADEFSGTPVSDFDTPF